MFMWIDWIGLAWLDHQALCILIFWSQLLIYYWSLFSQLHKIRSSPLILRRTASMCAR
jgi:hypothetical protein